MNHIIPCLVFIFFILIGYSSCDSNEKKSNPRVEIQESFSTIEVFNLLVEANDTLRQNELDSISGIRTGVKILDTMYANAKKNEINNMNNEDKSPLFRVFFPNVENNGIIQTSAIIGYSTNPILLTKYLEQTSGVYHANLEWKLTGRPQKDIKYLHALKSDKPKMRVNIAEIESVVLEESKFSIFHVLSNLKSGSEHRVNLKFKQDFRKKIGNRFYTILLKYDSIEYSGAINPNEEICYIGSFSNADFQKLKKSFQDKIKYAE